MTNISAAAFDYRTSGKTPELVWGFPPGTSIVDFVPEDMKAVINSHWNKFPPVNPMWHYLLGFAFIIIGMFSITGITL